MNSAKDFEIELRREWADKVEEIGMVVQEIGLYALRSVVLMSPVGNPSLWKNPYYPPGYVGGRFRSNWNVGLGAADETVTGELDVGGGAAIADGLSILGTYPEDEFPDVWITNNLPYALALENGHSTQAPQGMVALTVANIEAQFSGIEL